MNIDRMEYFVVALSVATLFVGATGHSRSHAAEVYGHVGTEGLGIGFGQGITDAVGFRGEANFGIYSRAIRSDGVSYDANVRLGGVGVYGDWFAFGNGFHFTGGLTFNDKQASGTGRSSSTTVNLNGNTYSIAGEQLVAKFEYPKVMPYIGVGWGHVPTHKGWGFVADIGLMFGKPKVSLSATPGLAAQAGADIEAERRLLQNDADDFRILPMLKIGVSYRF